MLNKIFKNQDSSKFTERRDKGGLESVEYGIELQLIIKSEAHEIQVMLFLLDQCYLYNKFKQFFTIKRKCCRINNDFNIFIYKRDHSYFVNHDIFFLYYYMDNSKSDSVFILCYFDKSLSSIWCCILYWRLNSVLFPFDYLSFKSSSVSTSIKVLFDLCKKKIFSLKCD